LPLHSTGKITALFISAQIDPGSNLNHAGKQKIKEINLYSSDFTKQRQKPFPLP
jgi:hypothetical protein